MSDVQIHPTAIVDPGAEIGAGTIVGPYCVIGPHVVLGAELLAATTCHALRTDARRCEEQILRLLLDRPADAGPKISRRTDLSGNRR